MAPTAASIPWVAWVGLTIAGGAGLAGFKGLVPADVGYLSEGFVLGGMMFWLFGVASERVRRFYFGFPDPIDPAERLAALDFARFEIDEVWKVLSSEGAEPLPAEDRVIAAGSAGRARRWMDRAMGREADPEPASKSSEGFRMSPPCG